MNILKIIGRFYFLYTLFAILSISVTSLSFIEIFPGIIIMWLCFFILVAGYKSNSGNDYFNIVDTNKSNWLIRQNKKNLFLIATFSILISIMVVRFYTGQTPISTIQFLINGESLYFEYQKHFKINEIGNFSIEKIPYVAMLVFLKFILIYSYVSFGLISKKLSKYDKFYLILITISSLYVGLARGTSFEFFELLILIILIALLKKGKFVFLITKKTIFLVITTIIMMYIFYAGITARGMEFSYRISNDINYNTSGIVPQLSSLLSSVIVLLFDYFGFGFFYLSKFVSDIWFSSLGSVFAGFFPQGIYLYSSLTISNHMKNLIDMGARWHPDSAFIINSWGFFGLLIFSFIIGYFVKYLNRELNHRIKSTLVYLTYYFILLQMIALPVGNFLRVSSANRFLFIILLFFWIWRFFRLPKIKFFSSKKNL
jgi:hypothetical protein